jgi:hypothetical protein
LAYRCREKEESMTHSAPPPLAETVPVKPYKADGGFEVPGLVMLVASMVAAGCLLGYVAHLVSHYLWLILLFPMIFGAALGGVAVYTIKKGRVRSPLIAGAVGFLGAFLMMALMHHFDYGRFVRQLHTDIPDWQTFRDMTPEQRAQEFPPPQGTFGHVSLEAKAEHEQTLRTLRAIDVDSFDEYLAMTAEDGVRLKSTRGSQSTGGSTITGMGVYALWSAEVLIAAAVAFFMGRSQAQAPYSRRAGAWKTPYLLGSVDPQQQKDVVAALKAGNIGRLRAAQPSPVVGPLLLTAYVSPADGEDDVDLKLESTNPNGKRGKEVMVSLPAAALPALQAMFNPVPNASDNASSAHPA